MAAGAPATARRATVAVALALVALTPPVADAQPAGKTPRVGMIVEGPDQRFLLAFRQGLERLGYVEGRGIGIEHRLVGTALDRIPDLVGELVRLGVDVLVVGGTAAGQAAKAASSSVPIVFVTAGDPVGSGLVTSLARPGGNATGLSIVVPDLAGKQIELLKTAAPKLSRVTVLVNPENPAAKNLLASAREAGRALGIEIEGLEARRGELDRALSTATARRAGALLIAGDPAFGAQLPRLARLAADGRLPAIYNRREFAEAGGLMAYGPSFADNYRHAATYVDRILKGATPAELPVEQPTKLELVINLRTAKALRLAMPPVLVGRADEVIQ